MSSIVTWIGIILCLSQSAMFSGMNLGLFSLSRMELQVAAKKGDPRATTLLDLRRNANFALVTILWGNVAVNVLLALLSGSILTGVAAFLFSTVVITIFAEILPQSYFTRNALSVASTLAPWLRLYQVLLYPVARPTAWILDAWLGDEPIGYYRERDLRQLLRLHMEATESEIDRVEGQGALNFLEIDDTPMHDEGEALVPESLLTLSFENGLPVFPQISPTPQDRFLRLVAASGKSWVIVVDSQGEPRLALRTEGFLREALFEPERFRPQRHCHHPIVVREPDATLGGLIQRFRVTPRHAEDDIVDDNVVLLWSQRPRIVTGTDILGRLLRGIAMRDSVA
jgi:metal transporter CNNM